MLFLTTLLTKYCISFDVKKVKVREVKQPQGHTANRGLRPRSVPPRLLGPWHSESSLWTTVEYDQECVRQVAPKGPH